MKNLIIFTLSVFIVSEFLWAHSTLSSQKRKIDSLQEELDSKTEELDSLNREYVDTMFGGR